LTPSRKTRPYIGAALAFNRVMLQLDMAYVQKKLGNPDGLRHLREIQAELVATCEIIDMPSVWRDHIRVASLIMGVLAGEQRCEDVEGALLSLEENQHLAEWEAHPYLGKSLCTPEVDAAMSLADRAVKVLERDSSLEPVYFMALRQMVELEARAIGKKTAGLPLAEAALSQRESWRLTMLAGMRAMLASERVRIERSTLLQQAYSDPLTGLANRRGLERHIKQLVADGVEEVALLFFDLDNLKPLNDRFGHCAGDVVLCRLTDVLTSSVRHGGFVARIGGDEFALLLAGADVDAAAKRAEEVARQLNALAWDDIGPNVEVSVSAGVATGLLSEIVTITREADAALYRVKSARRSTRLNPIATSSPALGLGRLAVGS
jgi:diguanylate cyclase (GGDEF)-like protein